MIDIDITELLEDYVRLLEKGGVPRESTESKIMLSAKEEIEELRKKLKFWNDMAQKYNESRLRYMDCINNAMDYVENVCKHIRENSIDDSVCGMCRYYGITTSGEPMECPGFHEDGCFKLNRKAFRDFVFRKDEMNEEGKE